MVKKAKSRHKPEVPAGALSQRHLPDRIESGETRRAYRPPGEALAVIRSARRPVEDVEGELHVALQAVLRVLVPVFRQVAAKRPEFLRTGPNRR